MPEMPDRPGPDVPPFSIVLHCADGKPRAFPMYADAAYDNAHAAMRWPDRPFSGEVLAELDRRDAIQWTITRLYTRLLTRGEGSLYFTDKEGHEWGFPVRSVLAVEVHDPEAKEREPEPSMGFRPPKTDLPSNDVPFPSERRD